MEVHFHLERGSIYILPELSSYSQKLFMLQKGLWFSQNELQVLSWSPDDGALHGSQSSGSSLWPSHLPFPFPPPTSFVDSLSHLPCLLPSFGCSSLFSYPFLYPLIFLRCKRLATGGWLGAVGGSCRQDLLPQFISLPSFPAVPSSDPKVLELNT